MTLRAAPASAYNPVGMGVGISSLRTPLTFGEFVLDPSARLLMRRGAAVHLPPKAIDLLMLLASRRPAAVSKEDIHEALWPGIFVTDATLSTLVFELRAALGESARAPRFIRTVHGFGYAFGGETTPVAAGTTCRLVCEGRDIPLPDGEHVIGRSVDCSIRLDSTGVSRRHARLTVAGASALLADCSSTNGTFVGGERIEGEVELHDGDEIRFGSVTAVFRNSQDEPETDLLPRKQT
jgi:DNA-binding winged helix-turn-helix (wHTH) protein